MSTKAKKKAKSTTSQTEKRMLRAMSGQAAKTESDKKLQTDIDKIKRRGGIVDIPYD